MEHTLVVGQQVEGQGGEERFVDDAVGMYYSQFMEVSGEALLGSRSVFNQIVVVVQGSQRNHRMELIKQLQAVLDELRRGSNQGVFQKNGLGHFFELRESVLDSVFVQSDF